MEESTGERTNATSARFSEYFRREVRALQNQIDHVRNIATAGGERFYALDHCSAGIARLSQEVQNVASTLPAYDHKTLVEAIKALTDRLSKTRAVVAPRPRFQFKSRLTEPGTTVKATITPSTNVSLQSSRNSSFSGDIVPGDILIQQQQDGGEGNAQSHNETKQRKSLLRISDASNEIIFRSTLTTDSNSSPPDQAEISTIRKSVVVWHPGEATSLMNKDVEGTDSISASTKQHNSRSQTDSSNVSHGTNIESKTKTGATAIGSSSPSLKILRLRDIHHSLIIIAHSIGGAVYVSDVHDSIIALAGCQQLRMHGCKDVKVYAESTTGPVVEDCVGMGFARLPIALTTISSTPTTNEHGSANVWDHHIVDFSNPGGIKSSSAQPQPIPSKSSPSSGSNWYIIQPNERVRDDAWRRVIIAVAAATAEGKNEGEQLSAEEIFALCR